MRDSARFLLCLCLFAWLAACTKSQLAVPLPAALPERVELSSVPFYPQNAYQSAPAALAMMLNQRDVLTTPGFLKDQVYGTDAEGSRQVQVMAAARAHDMLVYPLKPGIADLLAEVAAGNPVLLLQDLGYGWYSKWRFSVLVGYDSREQELIMRSADNRREISDFATFDEAWERAGRWAVLTVPADLVPATAEAQQWLRAAKELDASGRNSAAQRAYRTATEHWPTEVAGWLALANSRQAEADLPGAQEALSEAIKQQPAMAETWLSLSQLLDKRGCAVAANAARQCARRLAVQATDSSVQGKQGSASPCSLKVICPAQ